jgi:hypothetical protein
MKKLIIVWQAMAIATLIVAVMYLCSSCCTEANANNNETIEYYYEDNYTVAPATGICLQDVQFSNGLPIYDNKPVVFTADVCQVLAMIFNNEDFKSYPIAAVAFDCGEYIVVDLD